MKVYLSQPFVSSILNDEQKRLVYQNVNCFLVQAFPTDSFDSFGLRLYECIIEVL